MMTAYQMGFDEREPTVVIALTAQTATAMIRAQVLPEDPVAREDHGDTDGDVHKFEHRVADGQDQVVLGDEVLRRLEQRYQAPEGVEGADQHEQDRREGDHAAQPSPRCRRRPPGC